LTAFGEPLLRFSAPVGVGLADAPALEVHVGGAEFNVAAAMAALGHPARLITAIPTGPLGEKVRRTALARSVVLVGEMAAPGRMGIYYYEAGAVPRPGWVEYDRALSAFSQWPWHETVWSQLIPREGIFFTTGITPALGSSAAMGVQAALRTAAEQGNRVAFDVNFREKLWTAAKAARVIRPLLEHVDYLFTSRNDAVRVLGAPDAPAEQLLDWLGRTYDLDVVTMVYNPDEKGPDPPVWRAVAWSRGEMFVHDEMGPVSTVDRIGAGDAYAAGFLSVVAAGGDVGLAVQLGSRLMALKSTYRGDFWPGTRAELEFLQAGAARGVVR